MPQWDGRFPMGDNLGPTSPRAFRLAVPVTLGLLVLPVVAGAQRIAGPQPGRAMAVVSSAPPAAEVPQRHANAIRRASPARLVVGGAIGAAVGLLTCNLISEATEEVEESSHCTTKGNLYFGIGGAALGVLVAWITD